MKIKVLGTRGKVQPSAPQHEKHTGFLIDDTILIDAGEPEYMEYEPKAVVFTHFHPDHAFFVPGDEQLDPEIPLFGPEEKDLVPRLKVVSGPFEIEGYRFQPVPVLHALKLRSLGYIIEKGGKSIFITGDVAWIEKVHLQKLPELDAVFTEATFMKKGGRVFRKKDRIFGHTGIPNLVQLLGPLTSKIVFSHYGNWFFENIAENRKSLKQIADTPELIPSFDGMVLTL